MSDPTPFADSAGSSRRLHGVLVADVTGFSKLMGEDEARAVAALVRIRDVVTALVPRHGGTLDVFVGDCFVALFDSAVDAVQAAIAIQTDLAGDGAGKERVQIRVGIHLGDVVRSGSEILGDSVNVAARLQAVAQPGGIAVSQDVYRAVRNRVNVPFRDVGAKALKNIREKTHIYEIQLGAPAVRAAPPAPRRRLLLGALGLAAAAALAFLAYRVAQRAPLPDLAQLAGEARPAAEPAPAEPAAPLTVGVTGFDIRGPVPDWMRDNTRDGLNTTLSKLERLRVLSREKIDFVRQRRGLSEIEVAEALGIQKMISGSLMMAGEEIVLEARVVEVSSGVLDASEAVRGDPDELIELQNEMAAAVIGALGVRLSQSEREQLFAGRTRDTLDAYRRLTDTFGEAGAGPAGPTASGDTTSWLDWPRSAHAQEGDAEPAILALLEAYRAALEREDVEAVAATHVDFDDQQRAGFARYFEGADDLRVTLEDVDVLVEGDEALVTFTRRDSFRDHKSGKELDLEVRLSSEVVRKDDRWLLRGVKRS